ncbi:MAG: hypothetical protein A4S09_13460 [Proteobacteria bacterium SG_bin7]|nr:MAG: hypothetical protein A4S09_13460 [Proteobacteria bacterium SG_bin7]
MFFKKNENSVPNIWTAQENVIHFYKVATTAFGGITFILLIALVASCFRDPIVIVKTEQGPEYYVGERKKIEIGKTEIERFTKGFISALYVWNNFESEALKKEISIFVEDELLEKIMAAQIQRYVKELKGKKMSQAITSVVVDVLSDKVLARFDRLLKIDGVPIVIPTELTLSMIQGTQTRINPMGIYISGILEHEGAK